jgi:hypothetical protein
MKGILGIVMAAALTAMVGCGAAPDPDPTPEPAPTVEQNVEPQTGTGGGGHHGIVTYSASPSSVCAASGAACTDQPCCDGSACGADGLCAANAI